MLQLMAQVSIHAPTKGATQSGTTGRGERMVSIHAPTKGATITGLKEAFINHVSIHAPTKGATIMKDVILTFRMFQSTLLRKERHKRMLYYNKHSSFNPRSYERSDKICQKLGMDLDVSIHAPTKGATKWGISMINFGLFQSTLLRKERRG